MKAWIWIGAAAITLGLGAVAGDEHGPDQEEIEALNPRDWAAQQVCKGQPFSWDGDMLTCYREKP